MPSPQRTPPPGAVGYWAGISNRLVHSGKTKKSVQVEIASGVGVGLPHTQAKGNQLGVCFGETLRQCLRINSLDAGRKADERSSSGVKHQILDFRPDQSGERFDPRAHVIEREGIAEAGFYRHR